MSQLHQRHVIATLLCCRRLKDSDLAALGKKFPDHFTQNTLTGTVDNLKLLLAMKQSFIKKPAEQPLGFFNPLADQNQARQKSVAFNTVTNPWRWFLMIDITTRLELA